MKSDSDYPLKYITARGAQTLANRLTCIVTIDAEGTVSLFHVDDKPYAQHSSVDNIGRWYSAVDTYLDLPYFDLPYLIGNVNKPWYECIWRPNVKMRNT